MRKAADTVADKAVPLTEQAANKVQAKVHQVRCFQQHSIHQSIIRSQIQDTSSHDQATYRTNLVKACFLVDQID